MKITRILALTSAVVALGVPQAFAGDYNYTSHNEVTEKLTRTQGSALSAEQEIQLREYLDYEDREPCQFYQPAPPGFMIKGCKIVKKQPEPRAVVVQEETVTKTETPMPVSNLGISNVLTTYQVNFDLDSTVIDEQAAGILNQVARDIKKYNPSEVTLSGHADKSGASDYNYTLSQKRASVVSKALNDRGITNRILGEQAFGESAPEVPTPDGVLLRENRRVEIQFRK